MRCTVCTSALRDPVVEPVDGPPSSVTQSTPCVDFEMRKPSLFSQSIDLGSVLFMNDPTHCFQCSNVVCNRTTNGRDGPLANEVSLCEDRFGKGFVRSCVCFQCGELEEPLNPESSWFCLHDQYSGFFLFLFILFAF